MRKLDSLGGCTCTHKIPHRQPMFVAMVRSSGTCLKLKSPLALHPYERPLAASLSGIFEELPRCEETHAMTSTVTLPEANLGTWIRNDLGVRAFQGLSRNGPSWPQMIRRVARDLRSHQILGSLDCGNLPKLVLHKSCLSGCSCDSSASRDIETIFFYRMDTFHRPGSPFNDQHFQSTLSQVTWLV